MNQLLLEVNYHGCKPVVVHTELLTNMDVLSILC